MYLYSFFSLKMLKENSPNMELLGIQEKYSAKIFSRKVESIYTPVDCKRMFISILLNCP